MLIKFETKSARVKGLAFHPKRRWVLASLHNGLIQLWDYCDKTLMDKFDEHKGPVRGLDFHRNQPLFVSGGDDCKIKVWNYKSRRCLFTLDAHEDYVRTTYFHHEHPWILSCGDDQSIRIWNWQSRSRIAVLTGHTHYVMCAQFHPSQELIISASVDQTLRLWDITGLKMKNTSSTITQRDEITSGLPEILSKTDYSVESKEAHNSEINWCAFHPDPNKNLCLSAADDNYIKVWKFDSRNGLREVDALRGHFNSVNCAVFHPRKDLVLSASDDRSIRVWDVDKRSALSTHRKENDRFWTVVAHPRQNLFAAGHDNGLMLFKLEKERPAFHVCKDIILYIRGKSLLRYNVKTKDKKIISNLKSKVELTHYYHRLNCYSFEEGQTSQILVSVRSSNIEKSVYDLYRLTSKQYGDNAEANRSPGLTAVFIGPNRYAVLDKSKHVIFKINEEERKSKTVIPADEIFEAGAGRLFVKSKVNDVSTISLWDLEKGSPINSVKADAKFVIMSSNKNYIACVGSNRITICDGQLNVLSTIVEARKIKSAAWDDGGVLIYSTPVQLKYALPDGHTTTIMSTSPVVLYVVTIRNDTIFCLDRNGEVKELFVDSREFKFKQAVMKNDKAAILSSLRQLGSLTRAEISFLVKKGHPGIALKFVNDHRTRFPLTIQAFDIDEALKSAISLDEQKCWQILAETAMSVGNVHAAERAYKELKQPYKLAMLYLVCNQFDKLSEAQWMAHELGDTSSELIISLLSKDFEQMSHLLANRGWKTLAHTCAKTHGLDDVAADIYYELTPDQKSKVDQLDGSYANPDWMSAVGNSVFKNWPLLNDEQEDFAAVLDADTEGFVEDANSGDWGNDEELQSNRSEGGDREELEELVDAQEDGWVDDDEPLEDLLDEDMLEDEDDTNAIDLDQSPGQSASSKWVQISDLALHHVLAGSPRTAIGMLQNQIALVDVDPLRPVITDLLLQSKVAVQGFALHPSLFVYPSSSDGFPTGGFKIEDLEDSLTDCYGLFSRGKFEEGIDNFRKLLLSTLFLQVYLSAKDDYPTLDEREERAREIIKICREYILALKIWIERKNITGKEFEDHKRGCELAAYFCKLELPKHRSLVLEKALKVFISKPNKEFQFHKTRTASSIARRSIVYLKDPKTVKHAEALEKSYDPQVDETIGFDYDDLNPYDLCAETFKPIYKGNQLVRCPLCGASYQPSYAHSTCKVCLVSSVGKQCSGIKFRASYLEE